MQYYFCLLTTEEGKDPLHVGYKYAMTKESDWVQCNEADNYLTGVVKGVDFLIHDGKSYMILKRYADVDNKRIITVCVESSYGCDVKEF